MAAIVMVAGVGHVALCFAQQTSEDPQDSTPATAPAQQTPQQEAFLKKFLHDEVKLWTSPSDLRTHDLKWLLPLGSGVAALLLTDRKVANEVRETDDWTRPSHVLSAMGGGGPMSVAPLTLLVLGKVGHNGKMAQTGRSALEAVAHSSLIVQAIKLIADRQRPSQDDGLGLFRKGGSSFPSGHAMTSWAFATVVAEQYPQNRWIRFGSYGFATGVSMSRIGGLNHFPSDVLVGASLGYLIGRYVVHHHGGN